MDTLCQCPLSHKSAQDLLSHTMNQKCNFQEITVRCWCVFHHGYHQNRQSKTCACGNSVLGRTSPRMQAHRENHSPRCESSPVWRVAEDASQNHSSASQMRCHTMSTVMCIRIRFELHAPTFPVCASTVEVQGDNSSSRGQNASMLPLPCCKELGVRFPPTTRPRVLALSVKHWRMTTQAVFPAITQTTCHSALSRLRTHNRLCVVKGMQLHACLGTLMAW